VSMNEILVSPAFDASTGTEEITLFEVGKRAHPLCVLTRLEAESLIIRLQGGLMHLDNNLLMPKVVANESS